jgi:hypothetical protein
VTQPRSQLAGVLGGLALTLGLHVAAGIAVLIAAGIAGALQPRSETALAIVIIFLAGLGLWQWLYVAPVAWIARRAGFAGLAKGLWIGGALGTLLAALWYGGMILMGVASRLAPPRPAATADSRSLHVQGLVESLDDTTLVVRTADGVSTLRVGPSTDYILLKAPAGHERVTAASLRAGARVSVDAWRSGAEASASIVRIVEEGREMP